MTSRYKPVGWKGEPYRHYLAAKGISTKVSNKLFLKDAMNDGFTEFFGNPKTKEVLVAFKYGKVPMNQKGMGIVNVRVPERDVARVVTLDRPMLYAEFAKRMKDKKMKRLAR